MQDVVASSAKKRNSAATHQEYHNKIKLHDCQERVYNNNICYCYAKNAQSVSEQFSHSTGKAEAVKCIIICMVVFKGQNSLFNLS